MANEIIEFIASRNSSSKLAGKAPNVKELEHVFRAALRAPDHARLKPWRFIVIEGSAREKLGELFASAAQTDDPSLDKETLDKYRQHPMRSPMLVVLVARLQSHPKVPEIEQQLSVGCAAQNILLAVESLGYAAIWRTGSHAFNPHVAKGLGLSDEEQNLGFIYIGERAGQVKSLPAYDMEDFVSYWRG